MHSLDLPLSLFLLLTLSLLCCRCKVVKWRGLLITRVILSVIYSCFFDQPSVFSLCSGLSLHQMFMVFYVVCHINKDFFPPFNFLKSPSMTNEEI